MVKKIILIHVLALTFFFPFFTEGVGRSNCYLGAITIMLCYKIFIQDEKKGGNNE